MISFVRYHIHVGLHKKRQILHLALLATFFDSSRWDNDEMLLWIKRSSVNLFFWIMTFEQDNVGRYRQKEKGLNYEKRFFEILSFSQFSQEIGWKFDYFCILSQLLNLMPG